MIVSLLNFDDNSYYVYMSVITDISVIMSRFTKHLKPSDISLSFLSGKGHLSNLELNGEVISAALQLPPWVVVSRVVCDTIRAKVPFTNINTDPVNFVRSLNVCVTTVHMVVTSALLQKILKCLLVAGTILFPERKDW